MNCPSCGRPAEFVENKEVYGRNIGKSFMMWICRPCDARVGVHNNDPEHPLGTMATKELRIWRMKAHSAIDPLWQDGPYYRKDIYRSLEKIFGREIHIGESDIETCQKIIEKFQHD